jgi:polysaccharide export outer membrane protein
MAAAFDLVSIRRGEAPDPPVYRGDIIVVDGSRTRQMYRDFLQAIPILSVFRPI